MGKRILIVDDHEGFRATARRMLEADGYEVVGEAATATAAIEDVERLSPEVVLLDVQLPDLDGIAVADRISALGAPPAVVLTSSRPRDDLGPLDGAPVRGFVPKDELSTRAIEELTG